ncbi:hypothetical protein AVEN_142424-1 [Araneus ventricosus]|uniref:Uncharacterized protein n=1 Tax=Araneus ventricosus TaxID=182803 RepID=A0A4Y2UV94_ARAVE|nr:hypothetical protein AVEN_140850-1 [Araneus ventricosus]GBO16749.1 hypothetical protein AVEN_142424-1 [Araneus ventricosus]
MGTVKDFAEEKEGDVGNDEKDTKSHEGQDKSNNQINKSLSLDEAVSQSVQFFVAGFDTISSAIANAVYLLALHPDIQNRTYEEVRDVLLKTEVTSCSIRYYAIATAIYRIKFQLGIRVNAYVLVLHWEDSLTDSTILAKIYESFSSEI